MSTTASAKAQAILKLRNLGYQMIDESVYETTNTRALIKCNQHNETWESTIGEAYRKAKYCSKCRYEDGDWEAIAENKGYTVLNVFEDNATFQCDKMHEPWTTKKHNIKFTDCKICTGKRITFGEIKSKIESRGFEILNPTEIANTKSRGIFKCPNNHEWETEVYNVYGDKSGCPHCSTTSGERRCGFILETIFQKPFIRTREIVDGNLELDLYNDELKIACEYNGIQHYIEDPNFFHRHGGFEEQQDRDARKIDFCLDNGIKLIVVPYTIKSFRENVDYIIANLEEYEVREIDWSAKEIEFNSSTENRISFDRMNSDIQEIAAAKNGTYVRSISEGRLYYVFRCSEGHEFKLQPSDAKRGRWCWDCSGRKPLSTESISDKLASVNIELLDTYEKTGKPLQIRCTVCDSEYESAWDNLKQREIKNGMCRECMAAHKKLDKMKDKLSQLGLSFNDKLYVDAKTNYKWVCKEGHDNIGNWNSIKARKNGCKECKLCKKC